jgi:glycerol kinase
MRCGRPGHATLIARKTGLVIDAYFSGTKLKWLLDNVPGARSRAARGELAFGTIDSWLVWNLTRGAAHVTDPSNASRTLLFDIRSGAWDDELLGLLDIPRSVLPKVVPSSAICATASIDGVDVPIAGIAGDQQAALFGQACHSPGLAKNTYGTGCFLLLNTGDSAVASANNLLTTVAWQRDGKTDYALEGSVFIGGAVVQWLRDGLKIIRAASEIEALAASAPGQRRHLFRARVRGPRRSALGLVCAGRDLRAHARGVGGAHRARRARGDRLPERRRARGHAEGRGITLTELRVDGGATANNLLMQFQADILGVPVVRPKVLETTALGAGYLAGLAVGYWKDSADVAANWKVDRVFEPAMDGARVQQLLGGWKKAVERAKHWE